MEISTLVGGLGIGGVLATFVRSYLDNKQMLAKRIFEEKRDAYIGYLNISNASQTMPKDQAIWARTAAFERVKLCGSSEVVKLLDVVANTPPGSPRDNIDRLVHAMRKDLSL